MRITRSVYALTAVIAISASMSVMADDSGRSAGSGPNPYSDCGIGAALFPSTPVGAVISNVIWDLGTTAVTSATASPETCNGKNAQAAVFILETYDSLAEETARGNGEHLLALFSIMEIDAEQQAAVLSTIRDEMASVVSGEHYAQLTRVEKSSAFYAMLTAAQEKQAG